MLVRRCGSMKWVRTGNALCWGWDLDDIRLTRFLDENKNERNIPLIVTVASASFMSVTTTTTTTTTTNLASLIELSRLICLLVSVIDCALIQDGLVTMRKITSDSWAPKKNSSCLIQTVYVCMYILHWQTRWYKMLRTVDKNTWTKKIYCMTRRFRSGRDSRPRSFSY